MRTFYTLFFKYGVFALMLLTELYLHTFSHTIAFIGAAINGVFNILPHAIAPSGGASLLTAYSLTLLMVGLLTTFLIWSVVKTWDVAQYVIATFVYGGLAAWLAPHILPNLAQISDSNSFFLFLGTMAAFLWLVSAAFVHGGLYRLEPKGYRDPKDMAATFLTVFPFILFGATSDDFSKKLNRWLNKLAPKQQSSAQSSTELIT